MYEILSQFYDDYLTHVDYKDWANYLKSLIDIDPKEILEYGCGTGNITQYIKEIFPEAEVIGVDKSEEMLTKALNRNIGSQVTYLKGDMKDFDPRTKADVIICAFDTINHLKPKDLKDFLKKVFNELNSPGIFLFDIPTESYIDDITESGSFVYDLDQSFCIWDLEREDKRIEHFFTFFIKEGDLYRREDESLTEYLILPEKIKKELKDIGFSSVETLDFKSLNKPDNNSERIQFKVLKK